MKKKSDCIRCGHPFLSHELLRRRIVVATVCCVCPCPLYVEGEVIE